MAQDSINKKLLSEVTVEELITAIDNKDKRAEIVQMEKCFERVFKKLSPEAKEVPKKKEMRIAVIDVDGVIYDASQKLTKALVAITDDILNTYYLRNRFTVFETVNHIYIASPLTALLGPLSMTGCVNQIEDLKETNELYAWIMDKEGYYNFYNITLDSVGNITKVSDDMYFVQNSDMILAIQTGVVVEENASQDDEQLQEEEEYNISYV